MLLQQQREKTAEGGENVVSLRDVCGKFGLKSRIVGVERVVLQLQQKQSAGDKK